MTSCYPPPRMRWNAAIGAIARCKRVSTGCGRKRRSVRVWRSICGVKRKPKAVNKPLHYFIVHELDKPGSSTTVSFRGFIFNDTNLGARLFGNLGNNRYQYNLAFFDMLEKQTNSGLNTFSLRDQRVV